MSPKVTCKVGDRYCVGVGSAVEQPTVGFSAMKFLQPNKISAKANAGFACDELRAFLDGELGRKYGRTLSAENEEHLRQAHDLMAQYEDSGDICHVHQAAQHVMAVLDSANHDDRPPEEPDRVERDLDTRPPGKAKKSAWDFLVPAI